MTISFVVERRADRQTITVYVVHLSATIGLEHESWAAYC